MRLAMIGAGVNGLLGVAMGAWAAHGAAGVLEPAQIDWVRTGAAYQLWHAAALLGLAALASRAPGRGLAVAAWCFCFGALGFSCSLYLLAVTDWRWLVWLTPAGGAAMLAGWMAVIVQGVVGWRGKLS